MNDMNMMIDEMEQFSEEDADEIIDPTEYDECAAVDIDQIGEEMMPNVHDWHGLGGWATDKKFIDWLKERQTKKPSNEK